MIDQEGFINSKLSCLDNIVDCPVIQRESRSSSYIRLLGWILEDVPRCPK